MAVAHGKNYSLHKQNTNITRIYRTQHMQFTSLALATDAALERATTKVPALRTRAAFVYSTAAPPSPMAAVRYWAQLQPADTVTAHQISCRTGPIKPMGTVTRTVSLAFVKVGSYLPENPTYHQRSDTECSPPGGEQYVT
jgi:hypothetical protein